jgi:putative redox protein
MEAKVVWNEGLAFTGTADSGFTVRLDSKKEVGGSDSGLRPTELVAIGTAGCTAMDVISILQKKRQQVSAFEVRVHAIRSEDHPRKFLKMTIEYIVAGTDIDPAAVERAVQLSEEKYCAVIATLRGNVEIDHKIVIKSAELTV